MRHVQILALMGQGVQVHALTKSQFKRLSVDRSNSSGQCDGINYVGIADYIQQIDVDHVLDQYKTILSPESYEYIATSKGV